VKVAVLADAAGVAGAAGTAPVVAIAGTGAAVEGALRGDGHVVLRVAAAPDGAWVGALREARPDLVFNLCEGVGGDARHEAGVIAALELLVGVPHTGSSAWTAALCQRKPAANAVLAAAGLPVPPWAVAAPGALGGAPAVGFPAIVKPAAEDASLGIGQGAVVGDEAALAACLAEAGRRWDGLLVQRFVDGREVNVGVVAGRVLPPSEIDFSAMPTGMWRIVSYRSKWEEGSDEDRGARPVCPADLPAPLAAEPEALALAAWRAVGGEAGGGGYGRVDFRVDRAGRPWLLEVNPNPDLAPDAGLARMARAAGLDYGALVRRVCALAAGRGGRGAGGRPVESLGASALGAAAGAA
jgi:D-alanine-D-alanine ligase